MIFRNVDGKAVASLRAGTLYKKVKRSIHFMKIYNGWAFDLKIINAAAEAGAKDIEILDKESGTRYNTTLEIFDSNAILFDYGHGEQLCLPLKWWTETKKDQMRLL